MEKNNFTNRYAKLYLGFVDYGIKLWNPRKIKNTYSQFNNKYGLKKSVYSFNFYLDCFGL
jgi:hypothetical protein